MEQTFVCIVGAGPAGLVLSLSLAKHGLESIILEQAPKITDDPRGVYLTGDSLRILADLGLAHEFPRIGHVPHKVMFHKSTFNVDPYYEIPNAHDVLQHALPAGLLQCQPELETVLREAIARNPRCHLRTGCKVTAISQGPTSMRVAYHDQARDTQTQLQATYLVGADGKRGIVRKEYLEPAAAVRQLPGLYPYRGTWIAANLHLTPPTPDTHPEMPLWKAGYTPEQVYDLFWPKGWHFCSPPGRALACGRFGPHAARLWRFEVDIGDMPCTEEQSLAVMWEHLRPCITRSLTIAGRATPITYPQDCIQVLRCRPFTFAHQVVNTWSDGQTLLIGDAAHVFPPFAGQGIGSGVRDAHQLAWRLRLLRERAVAPRSPAARRLLDGWASERRTSIDTAAFLTFLNGSMCNGTEPWWLRAARGVDSLLKTLPWAPAPPDPQLLAEMRGFAGAKDGFGVRAAKGGGRMAQIWATDDGERCLLSDRMFEHVPSVLALLVVGGVDLGRLVCEARDVIAASGVDDKVVSSASVVAFNAGGWAPRVDLHVWGAAAPALLAEQGIAPETHDAAAFLSRFGAGARFVLVRPDGFIFSVARSEGELRRHLKRLGELIA